MIRRLLIALTLVLGLAAATGAAAQSSGAKAIVDAAKAQGLVGEQGDGFLGLVNGSADPATTAAVAQINAGRMQAYQSIAAKTGVTQSAAGEATANQLLNRVPAGEFYKPIGAGWMRK
jgi:uncharacterized protein YdbL (DUF1318 family)